MNDYDWYLYFWVTEPSLRNNSSINGLLRSPFTCRSLQVKMLLHPDSAACQAYQHLRELFCQYFRTQFYQYTRPQDQQALPLQTYIEIFLQVDQSLVLEADQYLRHKVHLELYERHGMGYFGAYHSHPIMHLQGVGTPSEASWFRNHLLPGSLGTTTYSSISNLASQPVSGPQGASSATTAGPPDQPIGTGTEEPELWKHGHSLDTRADPSDRAHYFQGISGQFNKALTYPPSPHLEVDDDEFEANQPHLPSSQTVTWANSLPIFTDELLEEGDKEARQGRNTAGHRSCYMCRQRFIGYHESLRHLDHAHLLFEVWTCTMGECAMYWTDTPEHRLLRPGVHGHVFPRQDYYKKHLTKKHGIIDATKRKEHAQRAKVVLCPPPIRLLCSVSGCEVKYEGEKVLLKYLKHVHEDHPAGLETNTWRNALIPYLLDTGRVISEPEGLRLATYRDTTS
ncbi:hypothetical protein N3K66_004225 [Trichothecium roseum]|uniref:Uncharacterized protein n=1 Tax=Trichothecium roseum TaxID=47278 RepID=A0ACC0V0N4_9HYPO|nr:hypothetical protein N3K66_004225 [Trichothecium roseum]